jgi:acetylornithine aminotransferase
MQIFIRWLREWEMDLPIGGILIAPYIQPKFGMLGTTFGGNPLACAAAIAVLEVMKQEKLTSAAAEKVIF